MITEKTKTIISGPEHTSPANLALPENYVEFIDAHPEVASLVESFRQKVNEIKFVKLGELKHSDTEGFIGMGEEKSVFRVDNLAVKVLHEDLHEVQLFNEQVNSLLKGLGVPGLEQIVTADEEQGIIVTKIVNGKSVPTISSRELATSITKDHIHKLHDTLRKMSELGLYFDNIKNVLFDPENGFSFVDYRDVSRGKDSYSADSKSPDFNPEYRYATEQQTLSVFLSRVLDKKEFTIDNFFNLHGELERGFKRTLGRRALKTLVRLKSGSLMDE